MVHAQKWFRWSGLPPWKPDTQGTLNLGLEDWFTTERAKGRTSWRTRVKSRTGLHTAANRLHTACTCSGNEVDRTPRPPLLGASEEGCVLPQRPPSPRSQKCLLSAPQTLASVSENLWNQASVHEGRSVSLATPEAEHRQQPHGEPASSLALEHSELTGASPNLQICWYRTETQKQSLQVLTLY